jgi:hypothetical protein
MRSYMELKGGWGPVIAVANSTNTHSQFSDHDSVNSGTASHDVKADILNIFVDVVKVQVMLVMWNNWMPFLDAVNVSVILKSS